MHMISQLAIFPAFIITQSLCFVEIERQVSLNYDSLLNNDFFGFPENELPGNAIYFSDM